MPSAAAPAPLTPTPGSGVSGQGPCLHLHHESARTAPPPFPPSAPHWSGLTSQELVPHQECPPWGPEVTTTGPMVKVGRGRSARPSRWRPSDWVHSWGLSRRWG